MAVVMTALLRKSQVSEMKRVKEREYADRLQSAETSPRLVSALVSGFDDGWRSCLTALIESGQLEWAPEPPLPDASGKSQS